MDYGGWGRCNFSNPSLISFFYFFLYLRYGPTWVWTFFFGKFAFVCRVWYCGRRKISVPCQIAASTLCGHHWIAMHVTEAGRGDQDIGWPHSPVYINREGNQKQHLYCQYQLHQLMVSIMVSCDSWCLPLIYSIDFMLNKQKNISSIWRFVSVSYTHFYYFDFCHARNCGMFSISYFTLKYKYPLSENQSGPVHIFASKEIFYAIWEFSKPEYSQCAMGLIFWSWRVQNVL